MARLRRIHRRGFSLVEMLVAVALFAMVGSMALLSFMSGVQSRRRAMNRLDIFETSRTLLDIMALDLGSATLRPEDTTMPMQDQDIENDLNNCDLSKFLDSNTAPYNEFNHRGRLRLVDWPHFDDGHNPNPPVNEDPNSPDNDGKWKGNCKNDDGDSQTDEEAYDGYDNDGDGLTDEDIFYPRDMINFMCPQGTSGELVEVGYSLDQTGENLYRRFFNETSFEGEDTLVPVDGLFFHPSEDPNGPNFPDPENPPAVVEYKEGKEVAPDEWKLTGYTPKFENRDSSKNVSLMALGVVGLDFRCYYQDYAINYNLQHPDAQLNVVPGPRLTPLCLNNQYGVPMLSWDSSFEQGNLYADFIYSRFPDLTAMGNEIRVLPNGPDDLEILRKHYPPPNSPQSSSCDPAQQTAAREALMATDGLPRVIDITVFLKGSSDDNAEAAPVWRRVFLPQAAGDDN